jgi:hypothetical protein
MIYLYLKGQLGNQLFQYASVKTLAEEKGFKLYFGGLKSSLEPFTIPRLLGQKVISRLTRTSDSRVVFKASKLVNQVIKQRFDKKFRPKYENYSEEVIFECFDDSFFELNDNTFIDGYFQSEKYFRHNREQILTWFDLQPKYLEKLKEVEEQINVPPSQRVCIHIRRGDYAISDMGLARGTQGWQLPIAYYKAAVQELPQDLSYVVISDEPDFAEEALAFLPNKFISRGNPAVVDMFLMTKSRFNIIANSSLSWWGAWLNQFPDKVVFSPKYHLGWAKGFWVPDEIKVPEWNYIDVLSLL